MRQRMRFGDVRAQGASGLSRVMSIIRASAYKLLAPPANTVAPVVSGSTPSGSTLSCTTGTWTGTPTSYAYQWKRGVTNVGTDQNTYVTQVADEGSSVTCTVTATNAGGSASQVSNGITVTAAPTAVWDAARKNVNATLSNSDKTIVYSTVSGANGITPATVTVTSGIYYCEFNIGAASNEQSDIGLIRANATGLTGNPLNAIDKANCFNTLGYTYKDGSFLGSIGAYTAADVIGMVVNIATTTITFLKNNSVLGTLSLTTHGTGGYLLAVSQDDINKGTNITLVTAQASMTYPGNLAGYGATEWK